MEYSSARAKLDLTDGGDMPFASNEGSGPEQRVTLPFEGYGGHLVVGGREAAAH
jgi:hypothetical protein